MSKNERLMELDLDQIVCDEELKVRVETDQETVQDYYDAMETEEDLKKFPPITVYFDGHRYWLADGHHRYWAALRRGHKKMTVRGIDGSHDDAILAAVKLNMNHGLRFKESDWEKIVLLIASKEQWRDWSNRKLADVLHCNEITIRRYRPDDSGATAVAPGKRRGKDGKMYPATVKKQKEPEAAPAEPEQSEPVTVEAQVPIEPCEPATSPAPEETGVKTKPVSDEDRRRIEANVKRTQIETAVSQLEVWIPEWFDAAPNDTHKDFDMDIGNRLRALCR